MSLPQPWPMTVDGVLLRQAREDDIDVIVGFRNLPDVNRWMLRTHVDPDVIRREWRAVPTNPREYSCVADVADVGGEVAGVGFLDVTDGMGQPGMPLGTEAVIGYLTRPGFEGRGVATAVARGLLGAAFTTVGVRRVTAGCFADNHASARVLEKAGMRREQHGIGDSWHAEHGWIDGCTYGMLAHEWPPR